MADLLQTRSKSATFLVMFTKVAVILLSALPIDFF